MAQQVTILVNGQPVTVPESTPGLYGQLGYQYVSQPKTTPNQSSASTTTPTTAPSGELPYQTWERLTGMPWSKASAMGLTSGSAADNLALQQRLLSGWRPSSTSSNVTTTTTPSTKDDNKEDTTEWLKSLDMWDLLSGDEQDFMTKVYDFVSTKGTQENIQLLTTALAEAETEVNPYWSEQLRIAQQSLIDTLTGLSTDYQYQSEQLQNNIARIEEDLTLYRDRLTLDQQAELAKQKENYKQQLEQVQETAAAQGLTFSTKRKTAESRLYGSYYDPRYGIMESTNRAYQRQIADLETQAARGNVDAQNQLAYLKQKTQQSATSTWQQAEQYLGSSRLPSLPQLEGISSLSGLGGISGDWAREKESDIWTLAQKKLQLANPFI